jgi:hypothetical protein
LRTLRLRELQRRGGWSSSSFSFSFFLFLATGAFGPGDCRKAI